jgi:hypothetical protein
LNDEIHLRLHSKGVGGDLILNPFLFLLNTHIRLWAPRRPPVVLHAISSSPHLPKSREECSSIEPYKNGGQLTIKDTKFLIGADMIISTET